MKNKILIIIAVLLTVFVIFVRYTYKLKLEEFKSSISIFEKSQMDAFLVAKNEKMQSLKNKEPIIYQLYENQFNDFIAVTEEDTSFVFLYLNDEVKYKFPNIEYIECLYDKCLIDNENKTCQRAIDVKVAALEQKFGNTFSTWYAELKDQKLINRTFVPISCKSSLDSTFKISYKEESWKDFELFLMSYVNERKNMDYENEKINNKLKNLTESTRNKLNSNVIGIFDDRISADKDQLLTTEMVPKVFTSNTLGNINYNLELKTIDKNKFNEIADEVFMEQWKYNSLKQGAMPYSNCFGSSNSCNLYGCSQISVKSGSTDVLVTIKNSDDKVYRHGYVKAGRTFVFNVPNGTYQVFFYNGSGWNPNKQMSSNVCGALKGGFVSEESFTKDSPIDLYNQIMSYELIVRENGNLITQPSSISEAF